MKKTKRIILVVCIVLIILAIIWTLVFINQKDNRPLAIFENKSFQVEIADNEQSRQQWLMYRENLDEDKWMLFVFEDDNIYSFWMKNTLIPLDMIWINELDGENIVVDIQTAQPCNTSDCEIYTPKWESRYVLEINAWLAEKYDIKVWDLMHIE